MTEETWLVAFRKMEKGLQWPTELSRIVAMHYFHAGWESAAELFWRGGFEAGKGYPNAEIIPDE